MKKLVKFVLVGGGVILGLFVLLLIIAAIAVPILFPPAKMKALVTDKLSETLKHKVTVGEVSFSVLSGFDVKNLKIANRAGWTDQSMVNAKDISISYHLWPLLWGQVSLKEITLNQPEILIERKGLNSFNFSDMTGNETASEAPAAAPAPKAAPAPAKSKAKPKKKAKHHAALILPNSEREAATFLIGEAAWADTASAPKKSMNITADGLNIVHGKLVYLDETVSPAQRYDLDDLNFHVKNISLVGGNSTFSLSTPLEAQGFKYQLSMGGSYRYFMSSNSVKGLNLTGDVNGLGFKLMGDAATMSENFTPNMDGEASLEMLKFSGLVPRSLASMPPGLALTGPARVDFHLGGSMNKGLELSGTADGSDLAIKYQDVSVKAAKTTCKVNFKSVASQNFSNYDLPSFSLLYQDWEVDGSFHYHKGTPWTCHVQSKDLPLKGLSAMIPKLNKATFGGDLSLNVDFVQSIGKATPFTYNGLISFKDVSITLPNEPYLKGLNCGVYLAGNSVKIPMAKFQSFDGTGMAGITVTLGTVPSYNYAFRLDGVDAQKAIDASIDAYVSTKDYSAYKDKLYGTMNIAYAGLGKGTSGDQMMASQVGGGSYSLVNAKVKGLAAIKAINSAVKDPSDEIHFDKVEGTLAMRNKVFSFTANTTDKVGALRVKGGINADGVYTPDMTIQCDLKKDYVNSDAIKGQVPAEIRDKVTLDWAADDNGNIPIDFNFTGKAADNNYHWNTDRLASNVKKHISKALGDAATQAVQQGAQNLGNQLKGLFH